MSKLASDLINFIDQAVTPYHAVASASELLKSKSFQELNLRDKWQLKEDGRYLLRINDSAFFAFVVKDCQIEEEGFKIIAAHTDAPAFKVKPSCEIRESKYVKLNTEPYGSPIVSTWLDRPLSLAGRVVVKGENPFQPVTHLVDFKKPILTIPNIAIHVNRSHNEGYKYNPQKDLLPVLASMEDNINDDHYLIKMLEKSLQVSQEEILDFDLFLYGLEKGTLCGGREEFISAGRLDDLAMVFLSLKALLEAKPAKGIKLIACFDNEEIGSKTRQGADSPLLAMILEKICLALGKDRDDYHRSISNSFLVSADMAHAVHPNAPEMSDPTNKNFLNGGPVLKYNANYSYTTDGYSGAVIEDICNKEQIPLQKFTNRSDQRGGSTLGPLVTSQLTLTSVDIGNPLLAMHSIRELAGIKDLDYSYKLFKCILES